MKISDPSRLAYLLAATLLLACGGESANPEAQPEAVATPSRLSVYTVNNPLAYFAERIGGDRLEVSFPAPPGVDPAHWSPDAETVAAYQNADLVLLNGADYAKWVARVSLPSSKLVDTSAAFADRYLPLEDQVVHTHGPTGEHSHSGWASTTWLDPALALAQGEAIRAALVAADPEGEAAYAAGLEALQIDLESLDRELGQVTQQLTGRPMIFSHPVYQYFASRYGLSARSLSWEPDELPDEKAWAELDALLREHGADLMLWEAEPLPEITQRLASRGISVVVYFPGANRPADGDWLSLMRDSVRDLAVSIEQ
jgi:zinc transport system substrate-binding protein